MSPSQVYFTNLRAKPGDNLLDKLERLITKAGMGSMDFDGKYVAIKIHFGEPGNMAYLRPNFARVVVDYIKARGGKPFLTDCNTLYVGGRKNALDHLESAYANGYNPFTVGCHLIIADGLKGTDEAYVPVEGGEYVKEAKIGRAVMDADIVISLNHFKGHEATGFGGALKNLGHGLRLPGGQDGDALRWKAPHRPGSVHRLRCLPACLRPRRSHHDRQTHHHRPRQVRGLRSVHWRVPPGCYPPRQR